MNVLVKTCVLASQLMLASVLSAHATPSPAVVISDQIIGTTPVSFFVIRTTTLNPPIYYQYGRRLEFVEISVRDGSILERCLLRETEYLSDAGVEQETWTQTEKQQPSCRVFEKLSERKASYIEPTSAGNGATVFRLSANGLEAREETSDDNVVWTNLMSVEAIMARAARATAVPVAEIPWQTGEDPSGTLSLIGTDNAGEPLHETCRLDPVPATSRNDDRIFLRFLCWSGDADADGANFYIALENQR